MKRIWDFIADLRLAFWILLALTATMYAGSIYSSLDYSLFDTMNSMRAQDWFLQHGITNLSRTWWIPLLFILFTGLGISGIACAADRIWALLKTRRNHALRQYLLLLSPSLIHITFIAMLAGHFLTFTMIEQQRIPVTESTVISLPEGGTLGITGIKHDYYDENTSLANRVRQTHVGLDYRKDGSTRRIELAFLSTVTLEGMRLHLDMKKKSRMEPRIINKETCNKEQHYHVEKKNGDGAPELSIITTRDPGVTIIFAGFCVIIVLMTWYFPQAYNRNGA